MTREEFKQYLSGLTFSSFKPISVTYHHTASPSLAQRPNGFSAQHLINLRDYYGKTLGWNGAPHIFIDDVGDGIIVFQRMDRRGVHAVSFNSRYWGMEMLGDYDNESFTTGRGAKVRDNAIAAGAIMLESLGASPESIKFHRDDPKTSKTCPGTKVNKADIIARLHQYMGSQDDHEDQVETFESPTITLPNKTLFTNTREKDGRIQVPARAFLTALDSSLVSTLKKSGNFITFSTFKLNISSIDEKGNTWVFLRDVANALHLKIKLLQSGAVELTN